jgi:hypothetical protein
LDCKILKIEIIIGRQSWSRDIFSTRKSHATLGSCLPNNYAFLTENLTIHFGSCRFYHKDCGPVWVQWPVGPRQIWKCDRGYISGLVIFAVGWVLLRRWL